MDGGTAGPLRAKIFSDGRHVVVGTPELASLRVSGVFRIGNAEGFLYSLREALGLETHEGPGEVVLIARGS